MSSKHATKPIPHQRWRARKALEQNVERDELATLLIRCRADRDLTQEDVGNAINRSIKTISEIENGKVRGHRTTRIRLVDFLNKHGYFPKREAA